MDAQSTLADPVANAAQTPVTTASRASIIVDQDLPAGLAANAAAILAATLGARHPGVIGEDLVDGSGAVHPGLMPKGLPVLAVAREELPGLRQKALARGLFVADFPAVGQETTDYEELREVVSRTEGAGLGYVGLLVAGDPKAVGKVTGRIGLLR